MVAMRGKKCVAIAGDLRLGNRNMSLAANFEKVGYRYVLMARY